MKMKVTADVNKAYILPRCNYENNVFDNLVVFFSVHKAYVYVFYESVFFFKHYRNVYNTWYYISLRQ